ncbi:MAG: nucleotidyltransferase family protein [Pyrinomonadaceae bacterium]
MNDKNAGHEASDRWAIIDSKAKEYRLCSLFRSFQEHSIDAIAIKGWSLGRFYPGHRPRAYSDIDVSVQPENYLKARELLSSLNINVVVDLHSGLRTLDTREWSTLFSRSYTVTLNNIDVRVLGDEDNLSVTATHWLIDGGINKDRLWDIYYLVVNRTEKFDWDTCLNANGPVRRSWVLAVIATARDYLALDVSELPRDVQQFELPSWYRQTIEKEWHRGLYMRVPFRFALKDPRLLLEYVYRRFPPNPIASTIEVERTIDKSTRFGTQFQSLKKKGLAFVKQISAKKGGEG